MHGLHRVIIRSTGVGVPLAATRLIWLEDKAYDNHVVLSVHDNV